MMLFFFINQQSIKQEEKKCIKSNNGQFALKNTSFCAKLYSWKELNLLFNMMEPIFVVFRSMSRVQVVPINRQTKYMHEKIMVVTFSAF